MIEISCQTNCVSQWLHSMVIPCTVYQHIIQAYICVYSIFICHHNTGIHEEAYRLGCSGSPVGLARASGMAACCTVFEHIYSLVTIVVPNSLSSQNHISYFTNIIFYYKTICKGISSTCKKGAFGLLIKISPSTSFY